ncbi:2-oxoacid:acceptor oxidoreductase family protein [Caldinitratiruptor microaerophilus]|uniref:Pyruvate/ketoisovalerate oxidoreductase catalytic domain-containing protein n=1 Tax=Caldinitratiruptor microaerophilus TaxID=671077 RepID=A0AA35CM87_9FIRM|nr:2-oxoacid:acceptor oxidoreductase family protein [Caldinitratiruptor microaerophilus]BDG60983.1 hypothetical protein caldi_20730 [Caldinitratiruptor microaerophilus]
MYHEITAWTRGIIMDKEARDVCNVVAAAAADEGYYSQYINDYVDAPDRTNCLIRKYARVSDSPIEELFVYENARPDIVVLVEQTLIKAVNFFRGTPDGEGVVIVNTTKEPEYLLRFLPDAMLAKLKTIVAVDAARLAEPRGSSPWMYNRSLPELAYDRLSTEGAGEKRQVGVGIAAPLLGALVAGTGVLKLESVVARCHDKEAVRRGYEGCKVLHYRSESHRATA